MNTGRIYTVKPLADRFWPKVQKTDGCWIWTAAVDHHGYGNIGAGRRSEGKIKAHRAAWLLAGGEDPGDRDLCHRCDNPRCVRPDHLFIGSRLDNMRDCVAKGRASRGSRNGHARLSEAAITEARRLLSQGVSRKELAAKFGVSHSGMCYALRGDTWKHM